MKTTKQKQQKELPIQTKFGSFLCVFESNRPEAGFTVTAPAAHDFVTYGPTLSAAKRMAKEGLEFHYECMALEHFAPRGRTLQHAVN